MNVGLQLEDRRRVRVGARERLRARRQRIRVGDKLQKGGRLCAGIREGRRWRQEKGDLLKTGMIILMGECSQARITSHNVLNIPDDIVDEFGGKGVCSEGADLRFQEIHLIGDILGMDDTYSRVSRTVQVVQGTAVNQILQLRLDS